MKLPDKLFVREERDPDFPCEAFTTKWVPMGERDCETDGHYRCWECTHKDPEIVFDKAGNGLVRVSEEAEE